MKRKFDIGGNLYYNMDCIGGARKHVPDGSVDLIITDPPYGIEGDKLHKHYNRNEDFVVDGYVEVPKAKYKEFTKRWIRQAARILRPGGSIYIVSGYTNLYHVLDAIRDTELEEVNHIIWKYNFGVYTKKKYVSSHYHILFYQKPGRKKVFNLASRYGVEEAGENGGSLNYQDREDVWIINREYKPGQSKNKNELPTELLIKMMQYSSNEGDLVCDLFMGGFSTARVAVGLNRRFVGFEVSEKIFADKIQEMEAVEPGYLMNRLRKPEPDTQKSRGQKWTAKETELFISRAKALFKTKRAKKDIIQTLSKEFGRGRWSVERMLNKHSISRKTGTKKLDEF